MDPDACLAKLLDAFRKGSHKHARFALEDLLGWITRGGALPQDSRVFTEQEAEISDRLLAAINDLMPMLQKLRGEPGHVGYSRGGRSLVQAGTADHTARHAEFARAGGGNGC